MKKNLGDTPRPPEKGAEPPFQSPIVDQVSKAKSAQDCRGVCAVFPTPNRVLIPMAFGTTIPQTPFLARKGEEFVAEGHPQTPVREGYGLSGLSHTTSACYSSR